MWVAEIRINGENSLFGSCAKENKVCISASTTATRFEKDGIYVSAVGIISGSEANIDKFIKDSKRDSRVIMMERNGRLLFSKFIEPVKFEPIHNMDIIKLKPIIINEEGYEFWTVGSLRKKTLRDFIDIYEKTHKGTLLSMKQEKVTDLSIFRMCPSITDAQWNAMTLAVSKGYYDYPRKVALEGLAGIAGKSYATFHAHLRKAERAIIPFFFSGMS